jgi:hypothetical protein
MSRKPIGANCGIEIRWRPTIVDGLPYCCLGCSRGGPCTQTRKLRVFLFACPTNLEDKELEGSGPSWPPPTGAKTATASPAISTSLILRSTAPASETTSAPSPPPAHTL